MPGPLRPYHRTNGRVAVAVLGYALVMAADPPRLEEIPEDLVRLYREVFLCRRKRWADPAQDDRRALAKLTRMIDAHPFWASLADEDAVARVHRALQQASAYPRPE